MIMEKIKTVQEKCLVKLFEILMWLILSLGQAHSEVRRSHQFFTVLFKFVSLLCFLLHCAHSFTAKQ